MNIREGQIIQDISIISKKIDKIWSFIKLILLIILGDIEQLIIGRNLNEYQ